MERLYAAPTAERVLALDGSRAAISVERVMAAACMSRAQSAGRARAADFGGTTIPGGSRGIRAQSEDQ